jgi:YjgF/chorismate_mutase-like, putative endoribonuclease
MNFSDKPTEAEQRLEFLGLELPSPTEALRRLCGNRADGALLFLSGTLPIEDGSPRFRGRIGENLSIDDGRSTAHLAALNAVALAKAHFAIPQSSQANCSSRRLTRNHAGLSRASRGSRRCLRVARDCVWSR